MHNRGQSRGPSNLRGVRPAIAMAVLLVAGGVVFNLSTSTADARRSQIGQAAGAVSGTGVEIASKAKGNNNNRNGNNGDRNAQARNNNNNQNRNNNAQARNNNNRNNGNNNNRNGNNNNRNGQAQAQGQPTPLATNCNRTRLQLHTGFQDGPRCIQTSFGEVASEDRNPTLLITDAPRQVNANQGFSITVSTRNLVRDRFLGAAAGGYYLESSLLTGNGITRGHFHTACRMLDSTGVAPQPDPEPAFFEATEDGRGGARPDSVTIQVPEGMPRGGIAQCAVWAGDGSHRIPMMQRANQIPAFDSVRIQVRG